MCGHIALPLCIEEQANEQAFGRQIVRVPPADSSCLELRRHPIPQLLGHDRLMQIIVHLTLVHDPAQVQGAAEQMV